ncbi:MAG: exodeoxyribonuclease III [Holosporales bacterium]|jgi:exodeoxyribonuclease-3|nr:exodeoxyribonuclease III [Holosporales bacterium]
MKIATWNVNSVRARLHVLELWIRQNNPDVILLQEIKCQSNVFPYEFFDNFGFSCSVFGQKSYNGVAIISKHMLEDVVCGLPTFLDDESARYIEAVIDGHIRVASVYVPNGGLVINGKDYLYKLEFLKRFKQHLDIIGKHDGEIALIGGDYNIAPDDFDVYNAKIWHERVCCTREERAAFRELISAGFLDVLHSVTTVFPRPFTWWDYRSYSFAHNFGLRIDHFLMTSSSMKTISNVFVDTMPRSMHKPSDHAPLICEIVS